MQHPTAAGSGLTTGPALKHSTAPALELDCAGTETLDDGAGTLRPRRHICFGPPLINQGVPKRSVTMPKD